AACNRSNVIGVRPTTRIDTSQSLRTHYKQKQRSQGRSGKDILLRRLPTDPAIDRHIVNVLSSRPADGSKTLCLLAQVILLLNDWFTYAGAARPDPRSCAGTSSSSKGAGRRSTAAPRPRSAGL